MQKSILAFSLSISALILGVCAAAVAQTKSAPPAAIKAPAPKAATKAATKAPAKAAGPNLLNPATLTAKAPEVFLAKLNTTKGPIVIRVTKAWAPNGAERFYNLVRAGFYNDAAFFRVIPGFMVQFGISARPEVSRVWADRNMPDDAVKQTNKRGMITYAKSSLPNSRSTQLFINYGNNGNLDADKFSPFGEVIEGMDVADKIYSGYGERPDQTLITAQGKAYLDKQFPQLDRVITAVIEPLPDAAPKSDAAKSDAKK